MANTDQHSSHKNHPYHLVNPSPWPIATSFALLIVAIGGVLWLNDKKAGPLTFAVGFLSLVFCVYRWWCDVIHEGMHDKAHNTIVQKGLRLGMALFILSEVMFFFGFFWSFFKASLDPVMILDGVWGVKESVFPPEGIKTFDPWDLPFMNTLILLLSGCTVTWAHYALLENNRKDLIQALWFTVLLGVSFTGLQALEYAHAPFKISEGIYPSNFYLATGFHGVHVIVGTIFLAVCLARAYKDQLSPTGHLGFEFAAWYWHFVDVVWLFLFVFVYVWGR